jgi:hypothetical protein
VQARDEAGINLLENELTERKTPPLLSKRVITSTWWEGLVLPMIPRAMPAGA